MALTTVIGYDVRENTRRAHLSALIQRFGDRVQLSVFVVRLAEEEFDDLWLKIGDLVDHRTDSVYAFRQCESCWESIRVIGQARPPEPVLYWAAF